MANTAVIRDAYGVPAMFVGSKTGRDDAAFVFIWVGDEERRMPRSEWDALPARSGARPSWAAKPVMPERSDAASIDAVDHATVSPVDGRS